MMFYSVSSHKVGLSLNSFICIEKHPENVCSNQHDHSVIIF